MTLTREFHAAGLIRRIDERKLPCQLILPRFITIFTLKLGNVGPSATVSVAKIHGKRRFVNITT